MKKAATPNGIAAFQKTQTVQIPPNVAMQLLADI